MEFNELEERMNKTLSVLEENFSEIRAGRANPAILNKVTVDYYGVPTPINQMAGISVPEARLIVIQPWDASVLKEIEKAILASDIGLNPNNVIAMSAAFIFISVKTTCINKIAKTVRIPSGTYIIK